MSYEASVIDLTAYGYNWEEIHLGDYVAIIDKDFCDDGLRIQARISEINRDLTSGDISITFGNISHSMTDYFQGIAKIQQAHGHQLL